MIKLNYVPQGLKDIENYYGNPDEEGWFDDNIVIVDLPCSLRYSWKDVFVDRFAAHRLIAPALLDALIEIIDYNGIMFLKEHNLDRFGGCYNRRNKRGSKTLKSVHYYAAAADYCPEYGPWGKHSRMPYFIVDAFKKRRFETFKLDGMHFQGALGY